MIYQSKTNASRIAFKPLVCQRCWRLHALTMLFGENTRKQQLHAAQGTIKLECLVQLIIQLFDEGEEEVLQEKRIQNYYQSGSRTGYTGSRQSVSLSQKTPFPSSSSELQRIPPTRMKNTPTRSAHPVGEARLESRVGLGILQVCLACGVAGHEVLLVWSFSVTTGAFWGNEVSQLTSGPRYSPGLRFFCYGGREFFSSFCIWFTLLSTFPSKRIWPGRLTWGLNMD